MTSLSRRAVVIGSAALASAPAFAQSPRTTTLVVPFPPGGSTDALARQLQPGLQERLARTVIVENKPGAAGSLGAATVAKAPADGSSLLVTFDSHAVIPSILAKPPLDVEKDLVPVFLVGTAPYVLATSPQRPFKTFSDIVAASKEKPGSVKYASVGIGTIGHLAMTLLAKLAGVEIIHVAYRGGGPAVNDAVGGHVDLVCGSAALITPQLTGGTLRAVMQMGRDRLPALGTTQTAIEAGFAEFEALAWWGIFAPKDTPQSTIAALVDAIRTTLSEPKVSGLLKESQQMSLILGGPDEMGKLFAEQVKLWSKVVRDHGITSQ